MDQNIALEALSALTGFTVKPHTPGGAKGGGPSAAFLTQLKSLTTSDGQPADQDFHGLSPTNELTIENLFSTIILNDTFQSLGRIGGAANSFSAKSFPSIDRTDAPPLKNELSLDMQKFFSPGYDYDFRNSKDSSECSRGGESYTRPWGWYRFALKVDDKYPGGSTWLGSMGWRSQSSPGEWPVSFHGTGLQGAEGITQGNYRPGPGAVYGYGIYSTPYISTAENEYSKTFRSKKDGKNYKVVMQNRINPAKRTITARKDYWLVKIDRNASPKEVDRIVTESIRPYGILIKQV